MIRSDLINEVGNTYGRLTVTAMGPRRNGCAAWVCDCSCGNTILATGTHLRCGDIRSCGCLRKEQAKKMGDRPRTVIDERDNTFGLLTVIGRGPKRGKHNTWVCVCRCGKTTTVEGRHLRSGNTKSCGDRAHRRTTLPPGISGLNALYQRYKHSASTRGLSFCLALEEFADLTKQKCHYCGMSPSSKIRVNRIASAGDYIYNGLDRTDNDCGYTLSNIVPCCGKCNRLKGKRSYGEFLSWVRRVYEHNRIVAE